MASPITLSGPADVYPAMEFTITAASALTINDLTWATSAGSSLTLSADRKSAACSVAINFFKLASTTAFTISIYSPSNKAGVSKSITVHPFVANISPSLSGIVSGTSQVFTVTISNYIPGLALSYAPFTNVGQTVPFTVGPVTNTPSGFSFTGTAAPGVTSKYIFTLYCNTVTLNGPEVVFTGAINPPIAVTALAVSVRWPDANQIYIGTTVTCDLAITPQNATTAVLWKSSDAALAAVDASSGVITIKQAFPAREATAADALSITAYTTAQAANASASLFITGSAVAVPAGKKFMINPSHAQKRINYGYALSCSYPLSKVTWACSSPAGTSPTGIVTPQNTIQLVAAGSLTISATTAMGESDTTTFTVAGLTGHVACFGCPLPGPGGNLDVVPYIPHADVILYSDGTTQDPRNFFGTGVVNSQLGITGPNFWLQPPAPNLTVPAATPEWLCVGENGAGPGPAAPCSMITNYNLPPSRSGGFFVCGTMDIFLNIPADLRTVDALTIGLGLLSVGETDSTKNFPYQFSVPAGTTDPTGSYVVAYNNTLNALEITTSSPLSASKPLAFYVRLVLDMPIYTAYLQRMQVTTALLRNGVPGSYYCMQYVALYRQGIYPALPAGARGPYTYPNNDQTMALTMAPGAPLTLAYSNAVPPPAPLQVKFTAAFSQFPELVTWTVSNPDVALFVDTTTGKAPYPTYASVATGSTAMGSPLSTTVTLQLLNAEVSDQVSVFARTASAGNMFLERQSFAYTGQLQVAWKLNSTHTPPPSVYVIGETGWFLEASTTGIYSSSDSAFEVPCPPLKWTSSGAACTLVPVPGTSKCAITFTEGGTVTVTLALAAPEAATATVYVLVAPSLSFAVAKPSVNITLSSLQTVQPSGCILLNLKTTPCAQATAVLSKSNTLQPCPLTWISSDKAHVQVDSAGGITGLQETVGNSVFITAVAPDSWVTTLTPAAGLCVGVTTAVVTEYIGVTMWTDMQSAQNSSEPLYLYASNGGQVVQNYNYTQAHADVAFINFHAPPAGAPPPIWSSSNPECVSVDVFGVITAIGNTTTPVYITASFPQWASVVTHPPAGLCIVVIFTVDYSLPPPPPAGLTGLTYMVPSCNLPNSTFTIPPRYSKRIGYTVEPDAVTVSLEVTKIVNGTDLLFDLNVPDIAGVMWPQAVNVAAGLNVATPDLSAVTITWPTPS